MILTFFVSCKSDTESIWTSCTLTHHSLVSHTFDSPFTFGCFVPFPCWSEVSAALRADEGLGHGRGDGVQVENSANTLLQAAQVDELRVGRVRDEMHLRRGRFGWRDL